jgi:hypothetical protein
VSPPALATGHQQRAAGADQRGGGHLGLPPVISEAEWLALAYAPDSGSLARANARTLELQRINQLPVRDAAIGAAALRRSRSSASSLSGGTGQPRCWLIANPNPGCSILIAAASAEGAHTGQGLPDYQLMHFGGALVGQYRLEVVRVPTVPAEPLKERGAGAGKTSGHPAPGPRVGQHVAPGVARGEP